MGKEAYFGVPGLIPKLAAVDGRVHLHQRTNSDCGAVATRTVNLANTARPLAYNVVKQALKTSSMGTDPESIEKFLALHSSKTICGEGWNRDDIVSMLRNQWVAIVLLQWGNPDEIARLDGGHYSIIDRVSPGNKFLTIEPSWFSRVGMAWDQLNDKTWVDKSIDGNRVYKHWLAAVPVNEMFVS